MPLKYLIDEHLRGKFTVALIETAATKGILLDVLEVGDDHAPPLGTKDPGLLQWMEAHQRVLISLDESSLPVHLENHLASGGNSPGILFIRQGHAWEDVLFYLLLYAEAAYPEDCRNSYTYIPL